MGVVLDVYLQISELTGRGYGWVGGWMDGWIEGENGERRKEERKNDG